MKTVRDDDGTRYVLLKRSKSASLVRDPETGNECYVCNDRLEELDDVSPLETAASAISDPVRRVITSVHDERSLGLLVELADRGPLGVRTILDSTDFCESDLHGRLVTWVAAGLLEETTVYGERGYQATEECVRALRALREAGVPNDENGSDHGGDSPDGRESGDENGSDDAGDPTDGCDSDVDTVTDHATAEGTAESETG